MWSESAAGGLCCLCVGIAWLRVEGIKCGVSVLQLVFVVCVLVLRGCE